MMFSEPLLEVGCKLLLEVFPSLYSRTFKSEIAVVLSPRAGWTIHNSTGTELQIIMTVAIFNLVEVTTPLR
jgi:hypothetical protein